MIAKIAFGIRAGIVWFVVLSVSDSSRVLSVDQRGQFPWGWLVLAAAASGLALWAFGALGRAFTGGVSGGVLLSIVVGLLSEPSIPELAAEAVFSFPMVFTVGSASAAVWIALGVSLVAAARWRRVGEHEVTQRESMATS